MLTQPVSQVRRLFETRIPGVKIPSRSTVDNLYNKFQAMGSVEPKKQHKPRSVIPVTKLTTSIEENEREFIKRCQKCMDNEGGQFQQLRQ